MKMNVYIDGNRVTWDFKACVTLPHKDFIVSIAQGKELKFTEVVIFPAQGIVLVDQLNIPALQQNYDSISEAMKAIDSIHVLIDAGLLKWEETDD